MIQSLPALRGWKSFSAAFLVGTALAGAQATLTAYYDFEPDDDPYNDPAGATADDLIGLFNPVLSEDVSSNAKGSSQSAAFDGNSALFTSAYSADLGPDPNAYTIMFWVMGADLEQENNNIRLMSVRRLPGGGNSATPAWQIEGFGNNGNNGDAMDLRMNDPAIPGNWFSPDAINALANLGETPEWRHVAFVVANSGHPTTGGAYSQTYVDGVSVGLAEQAAWNDFPLGNTNGQLIIGSDTENAGTRAFTGLLDDVALFAGVVDEADIASIAAGSLSPTETGSGVTLTLTDAQATAVSFDQAEVETVLNEPADEVFVVWDTADQGTAAVGDWANSMSLGAAAAGPVPATLTALAENTTYFVRFLGTQTPAAEVWSAGFSFTSLYQNPPPLLEAVTIVSIGFDRATVSSELKQGDGESVTLVWAFADQDETDVATWIAAEGGGSADLGAQSLDTLLTGMLTGLEDGTVYAYRFVATNAFGTDWSEPGVLTTFYERAVLKAYYDFEGTGNDRFDDPAGEFQDDLIGQHNPMFSPDTPGAFAGTQSASFAGDTALFTDAYSADLAPDPNAYTIMFWIKAADAAQEADNTRLMTTRLLPDGTGSGIGTWQVEGFGNNGNNGNAMDVRLQGAGVPANWFQPDAVGAIANTGQQTAWRHVAFVLSNFGHPDDNGAYGVTYIDGARVGNILNPDPRYDLFNIGNQQGQLIIGGDNESAGTRAFTGLLDDVALFAGIVSDQAIADIAAGVLSPIDFIGGRPTLRFTIESSGDDLVFAWDSAAGNAYTLRSSTTLHTEPLTWSPVMADLEATPPVNMLTIPRPADPQTFYVLEQHAPPPVFFDDFETDLGWTTGADRDSDTAWERGTPTAVGPVAAYSPVNCYGTNLAAVYDWDANVWLRSPAIDLTEPALTGASVRFFQFRDLEAGFDFGSLRVLDAADNSLLGAAVLSNVDGTSTDWEEVTAALPPEALGHSILLEFRFTSDPDTNFENLAGWYIDNVEVSVQ